MNAKHCALLLCLFACGDDPVAPEGPLLLGQWGTVGDNPARLIGLGIGAELQFTCSSVGINQPVSLDADGRFTFRGRWQISMAIQGEQTARVNGQVDGEIVDLAVDVLGDGLSAQRITLQKGVDPDFEALPPVCPS
jgi:hypothetical protein